MLSALLNPKDTAVAAMSFSIDHLEAHGRQVRHGEDQYQWAECSLKKLHDLVHGLSPLIFSGGAV